MYTPEHLMENAVAVARASWVSYVVLWVPVIILGGLYMGLASAGQQDAWVVAGILLLLGVIGTAGLMRLRLMLTGDTLSYRGAIRTVRIPIADIAAIHGTLIGREHSKKGPPKGPGFVLSIESVPGRKIDQLSVNMKPFDKRELHELFDAAKARGIPVHLDAVVVTMVHS